MDFSLHYFCHCNNYMEKEKVLTAKWAWHHRFQSCWLVHLGLIYAPEFFISRCFRTNKNSSIWRRFTLYILPFRKKAHCLLHHSVLLARFPPYTEARLGSICNRALPVKIFFIFNAASCYSAVLYQPFLATHYGHKHSPWMQVVLLRLTNFHMPH